MRVLELRLNPTEKSASFQSGRAHRLSIVRVRRTINVQLLRLFTSRRSKKYFLSYTAGKEETSIHESKRRREKALPQKSQVF